MNSILLLKKKGKKEKMKDKERNFYMVHDELFYDLVIPYKPLRKIERKSEVSFTNRASMFTVHELILWIILVDFRIKNPFPDFAISLSYIHKQYRKKRIGKTEVMSESDRQAYINALNGLQKKRINLKTGNTRKYYGQSNKEINNGRIFKIMNITADENGDLLFEYTLGQYGEIILKSKRYSDMLPISLLKIPYKQNMKLYIAMYISKLIFINKRKKLKEFTIITENIMRNVRLHNATGIDIGKSLYNLMRERDISKYAKLNLFNKYLIEVLEMLKDKGSIYGYDTSLEDGYKCHIDIKKP